MKLFKVVVSSLLLIFFFNTPVYANENQKNLTIYSTAIPGSIPSNFYQLNAENNSGYSIPGYALIRDKKQIELKEGENKISISDVSAYIDPTTVIFKSLTDPNGTNVLEQNYNFDLVNNKKLLEKYLGSEISVDQNVGNQITTFNGTLLSASGGLILREKQGGFVSINDYSNIHYSILPEGLTTKPTLAWNINTKKTGNHMVEISYQTAEITWWADYNAIYEEREDGINGTLDLNSWVSIINKTGTSYENAKLKLVAGDVNKIKNTTMLRGMPTFAALNSAAKTDNSGFSEKSFFEFHLYTLNGQTTILNNSTKQIALFENVLKVPAVKQFIYCGSEAMPYYGSLNTDADFGRQSNSKVNVYLKFKNTQQSGLGIPLPAGRMRVGKIDKQDNSWEFIGEDIIDHTAKDEDVMIKMGNAFDVIGERKQVDFNIDEKRHIIKETFEITIKNHKDQDINVMIKEDLYRWANWQIIENSDKYEKINAQAIQFPITVKKDDETKIRYTVQYTW